MATETNVVFPSLRCSPFHASLEADPIGSAGSYDAYLCVEIPLPWEHDISGNEPFASLRNGPKAAIVGADGRRWRPQGLIPLARPDGIVQVIAFAQPGAATTGRSGVAFERREWLVPTASVAELCAAILGTPGDPAGEELGGFARFEVPAVDTPRMEVFVCTHGQRDVCCGGSGTTLYKDLESLVGNPSVSVRRVSHTGGHRFAPTALTFPDGYAWAHLDPHLATAVVTRTVEPSELLGHIRGSTLFKGGPAQAADRYGLGQVGWEWADATRTVELIGFDRRTMATDIVVHGGLPDGSRRSFELRVVVDRHIPQITCGMIDSPEYEVEPVWRVSDAREI